jgi:D-arabinose 1-dehydrogenase-like Zn-dependent alcohol dehydrogenase
MLALIKSESGVGLAKTERPRPTDGEVVVKVMCAGLCRTDLYVTDGLLSVDSPRILGHECAGVICQTGPGVSPERLGERVAVFPWIGCGKCRYCAQESLGYLCSERRFLGWHTDGCFAEFMAVPADRCITLPEEVDFQAGAYLEPLTAALGVLKTPVKEAGRLAVLGDNRIADLTRLVLREFGGCEVSDIDEEENSFDLLVETNATEKSLRQAFHLLKPDGVLVLKSRPPAGVNWPVRLQVEKEITTIGASYGHVKMALLFLKTKGETFEPLWQTPGSIDGWSKAFDEERGGEDRHKVFFLPQEHSCAE